MRQHAEKTRAELLDRLLAEAERIQSTCNKEFEKQNARVRGYHETLEAMLAPLRNEMNNLRKENAGFMRELERQQRLYRDMYADYVSMADERTKLPAVGEAPGRASRQRNSPAPPAGPPSASLDRRAERIATAVRKHRGTHRLSVEGATTQCATSKFEDSLYLVTEKASPRLNLHLEQVEGRIADLCK